MTRFITVILAATLALAGCDTVPGRPKPDARELAPSEVIGFDTLYARNCAGCHGRDGRLGAARALNDPVYLALVPPERLRQVIAIGVSGIKPFCTGNAKEGLSTVSKYCHQQNH